MPNAYNTDIYGNTQIDEDGFEFVDFDRPADDDTDLDDDGEGVDADGDNE